MVAAGVLDRFVQTVGVEEVLGIAQTGVDVGADPDVPCRGILADAVVILGAVDLYVNADVLERGLRGFGQQGQLLTGRVGQPADRELDAVLFADAVAVGVDPAGGLQLGFGLIGIKGHGLNALTEREAVGEGTGRGVAVAVEQHVDEVLLVDAHGDRLADGGIAHDRIAGVLLVEVHHAPEAAAGLDAGELVVVVLKERIAGIGHAVGCVDFAGLERHGQRVTVRNGADGDLVDLDLTVPVVDVFDEIHMVVRDDFGRHIGTGADDAAVVGDTDFHVDDAAVGLGEIVHQDGVGLGGDDGQLLTVGLHRGDLEVAGGALVDLDQVLETGLDRGSVTLLAVGEADRILDHDLPGGRIDVGSALRQPGLERAVVRDLHQRLADAVADAGPAGIGVMRVDRRLFVFGVEGGVAEDKGLFSAGLGGFVGAAAAGQNAEREAERQKGS